ncbi:phage tail protein [Pseudochrobactrum sp. MP213Fo]|uniref:phage tail protein n=1 Tax=Pseudochrobactrum sp. MP213Fo TaxID=3022250 RepID=UPI003BA19527
MAIFTGIATAITGLLSSTFLSGAIGSFLLKTAVGLGISLLAQSIAGKPQDPVFSINGSLQAGGDLPRSFMIGRSATAGSLVWANTWGQDGDTPNAYLTQVIALSDLPVTGLRQVWVNGQAVTLAGNNTARGYRVPEFDNDGGNLWVKFYDGTQTTADSFLVNSCSNHNRHYDANRVGRGVAYVIVTARVSKQMFSGIPNFKFELDGIKLYDITKDSTAGGSGPQRWSDPSTWGGDGDHLPAVQEYNLLRGVRWNSQWFYGVQGMAAARLPAENWRQAIQKCRAPHWGAGGLEPTYRSGGEITIDAPLANALEALNTACQGRIAEIGGIYQMFLGLPDTPVIHFSDDDILSTDEQTFTPFFGLANTINGVSATYPSASDGWVVKSAPSIFRKDLEALHGNRRLMAAVELNFVPYAEQVQRLMKSALEEGQRARRHTLVLPPRFWAYCTPGTIIAWTSVRNGYANKLMRIDGAVDRANLDVLVDITEVDPSDYDWDSGSDFRPPVDGAVGPMRPAPMPMISFGALPDVAQDSEGNNRRCAIRLFWDGGVNGVDYVQYEVRKTETLAITDSGRAIDVKRAAILIAPGTLLPNQKYEVRARYGTYDGNTEFLWSDWILVITADIRLGVLDLYPFNLENFNAELQGIWADQAVNTRYLSEEITRITTALTQQTSTSASQIQGIRENLSVQVGANRAEYTRLISVEASERLSQVTAIQQLVAKNQQDIATVNLFAQSSITRIDGSLTALSQVVNQTQAQIGNVSAEGYFQVKSEANQGGSLSRISLSVSATAGGAASQAAIFIEAISGGKSRIIMDADAVIMTSGSARSAPFAFVGGVLTLMTAKVNEITAGKMRSFDNKVLFDLDAKLLVFRD